MRGELGVLQEVATKPETRADDGGFRATESESWGICCDLSAATRKYDQDTWCANGARREKSKAVYSALVS